MLPLCGHLDKFQTVFAGIFHNVAHDFHKVILLSQPGDIRRNIHGNIHPFALIHFGQRAGEAVNQRRNGGDVPHQHGIITADTGAVQIITDLLGNPSDLLKHNRLGGFNGHIFAAAQ